MLLCLIFLFTVAGMSVYSPCDASRLVEWGVVGGVQLRSVEHLVTLKKRPNRTR